MTRERRWEVGKALLFDDAFVHSVWNETDKERAVLLCDIWHPDLSADEIASWWLHLHHDRGRTKSGSCA